MNMRGAGIYPPKSRPDCSSMSAGSSFISKFPCPIEDASLAQLITFGSNALNSSGQHLIVECVHLAFVIEIDVVDSKALCDVHVSKGYCYSSFTGNLIAPSAIELVVHRL